MSRSIIRINSPFSTQVHMPWLPMNLSEVSVTHMVEGARVDRGLGSQTQNPIKPIYPQFPIPKTTAVPATHPVVGLLKT